MGIGTLLSALIMTLREDARLLGQVWYRIPEMLPLGKNGPVMAVGVSWSLLSIGSGMIVGLRVSISMLVGTILAWVIAPPLLLQHGMIDELVRRKVLLWMMWPATGMMVAGGLTALRAALAHCWSRRSSSSRVRRSTTTEFPLKWVGGGVIVLSIALVIVQRVSLGMPVWMTLVALVRSLVLTLVALRVLGETNWGPISTMSNMMQAIFGVVSPGHIGRNMAASGITGSIASQSEGLIQDYKTGYLIGSTPRFLTYSQLLAVPVGAATVAMVYPLLRDTYGIGGDHGLQSPISQRWAGFAKLLSAGLSALPPGAVQALVVGVLLGILFTVLESTRVKKWTPSPTGSRRSACWCRGAPSSACSSAP